MITLPVVRLDRCEDTSHAMLPEQELWVAVLDRALRDLREPAERAEAHSLFFDPGRRPQLDALCERAGVSPGWSKRVALKVLGLGPEVTDMVQQLYGRVDP